MNENYEVYAVAVIIVFGAATIGGLMGASIGFGERDAFFFSLGSAAVAWVAGYAIFFDRPRTFIACVALSVLMAIASALVLAS